jgi:hypothetical protein
MKLSVGHIEAQCPGCGGADFDIPEAAALTSDSVLACASCGRQNRYGDLLNQIGEQAMKQANESLAKLRGKKDE